MNKPLLLCLLLAGCAEQQRGECIDGYHMPPEDAWIREHEGYRTIYRKVTYSRWVCTAYAEWEE